MVRVFIAALFLFASGLAMGQESMIADDDVIIEGEYLRISLRPDSGGALDELVLLATGTNLAGGNGVAQEGFGVGSHYVPNRRLNEKVEMVVENNRPVVVYSYDCDGPNIQGLRVVRRIEPQIDQSSVRVRWSVENRGEESQFIAPWVRHEVQPGGSVGPEDRVDIPSLGGIVQPEGITWHPAARNWAAVTDTVAGQTFYSVFHADHLHSLLALNEVERGLLGFQAAFVPRILKPGESWHTLYRMNVVRGLKRVDVATDELAAQLDYENGRLTTLFSSARSLPKVQMVARIMAANQRVWQLPRKQFELEPAKLVRATYDWDAPASGHYDFLAQFQADGDVIDLGIETDSPHGGIDTQFTVGTPRRQALAAWTDAPFALDAGQRVLRRNLAVNNNVAKIWFEDPLFKLFPEDTVASQGGGKVTGHLELARGERESIQLALRPERPMAGISVRVGDLVHESNLGVLPAEAVRLYRVGYVDVRIPSHFEGPSGSFPDPLFPLEAFSLQAEETQPIWITVHASKDQAPGRYRGPLTLMANGEVVAELQLDVLVYRFILPDTPAFKTDFAYYPDAAMRGARAQGGSPNAEELAQAYARNAFEHRVTLREPHAFPASFSSVERAVQEFGPKLDRALAQGATTIHFPHTLLEQPAALQAVNRMVVAKGIQDKAFVQMHQEPAEPAFDRLFQALEEWKGLAPDIRMMVPTAGLRPFIPPTLDIWTLHAQVFDTVHNKQILEHIAADNEVWWYVNHTPPRPYGNFFLDFAAIEHRILFWQSWALGLRGMSYWGVNYFEEGQDPYQSLLDFTPVNGDGLLVYPGANGPVNSIRWETIRDGIEDYDYLAQFMERRRRLLAQGGHEELLARAAQVYNLGEVVPSLVTFTRDPEILQNKRRAIAQMIEEMDRALGR